MHFNRWIMSRDEGRISCWVNVSGLIKSQGCRANCFRMFAWNDEFQAAVGNVTRKTLLISVRCMSLHTLTLQPSSNACSFPPCGLNWEGHRSSHASPSDPAGKKKKKPHRPAEQAIALLLTGYLSWWPLSFYGLVTRWSRLALAHRTASCTSFCANRWTARRRLISHGEEDARNWRALTVCS